MLEFLEKTEDPPTNQINAGCYVFKKDLIATIPENRVVSVERETFPSVLEEGYKVYGHVDNSYWRDMGRPDDFVRGSSDLVRGIASSPLLAGKTGESLVDPSAGVAGGVLLLSGTSVGRGSEIGAGSRLDGTVVLMESPLSRARLFLTLLLPRARGLARMLILKIALLAKVLRLVPVANSNTVCVSSPV